MPLIKTSNKAPTVHEITKSSNASNSTVSDLKNGDLMVVNNTIIGSDSKQKSSQGELNAKLIGSVSAVHGGVSAMLTHTQNTVVEKSGGVGNLVSANNLLLSSAGALDHSQINSLAQAHFVNSAGSMGLVGSLNNINTCQNQVS